MLIVLKGDLFESDTQTIVNTINCVGAMGKGIALEYKKKYPEMYVKYVSLCKNKQISIGKLWLYKTETKWILNFPTKDDWRNPSKVEYLVLGLEKFVATYKDKGITSIAFPLLGANNGGLDPKLSLDIMVRYLKDLDIDVYIYDNQNK
jgi:O-acetyl-ADP-ribose deacetylase (regulator of RNase III)